MNHESMQTPDPTRAFPGPLAALGLYALLTLALTWPLAAHPQTHLPAGDNDLWQSVWNFWWWETSLTEFHQSPYHTDLIYQPGDVSLALHTHSEASIIQTFPVLLLAGVPAAYNMAIWIGFLLAGWGGYFLALEITKSRKAAFLAGVVLAFFPHHFEQSLEHVNLASFQAMPFFLFFLVRLVRRGGWSNTLLTGVFFALNCLYSWHNGLLVLPLAAVLFGWELRLGNRPAAKVVRDAALAAAASFVLVLPFLWPLLREIAAGSTAYIKPPVTKGIDPVFLLVPPAEHPLWGNLVRDLYASWRHYASVGFTCYAGAVALGLWLAGAPWTGRGSARDAAEDPGKTPPHWWLWTGLFTAFVLLALGDPLVIAGKETGIRLPFAVVRELPVFKTLRVANRFVVPAMIALSVLAALGARRLLDRADVRRRTFWFWGIAALIVADFLWTPYPVRKVPHPAWTDAVARCPRGLLWNIPGGYKARAAEDMYLQTLHGRRIVGGYTSCIPPRATRRVKSLPFLELVEEGRPSEALLRRADNPKVLEADLRRVLDEIPVEVIVFHRTRERERLLELRKKAQKAGLTRRYNPARGMPRRILLEIERILRSLWGDPCYEDVEVLVFARPGG